MLLYSLASCLFSLFLYLSSSSESIPSMNNGRIVGGQGTTINSFPYQLQVDLQDKKGQWYFLCGGVIIHKDFALTAGHCVDDIVGPPSSMRFRSGSSHVDSGDVHNTVMYVRHPNYSNGPPNGADFDVTVALVTPSFQFGHSTRPVPLASREPKQGKRATVSGWGSKQPEGRTVSVIRDVQLEIIDRNQCARKYGGEIINKNKICAGNPFGGGKDACQGDSGGPLVLDGKLVGLVSTGVGCADPRYPGIYCNVAKFRKWVKKTMKQLKKF